MKQPNILVYGSVNCPDTVRTRNFLDSHGISYEFKDVDASPQFNTYIADLNGGKRVIPTLRRENQTLVNPDEAQLREWIDQTEDRR
jgi:glutaredoxin